jgi:ElaB/YqjD/DUF883 family membrane-anchored ribosome-binding protein
MAATGEKDVADQIGTIRADIASLSKTASLLVSETAGIRASLAQRVANAAKTTVVAGERFLSEAEEFGSEAVQAATRGATDAVTDVKEEIGRNPLTAMLIALGFGFVCGFLSGGASRTTPVNAAPSRRVRRA